MLVNFFVVIFAYRPNFNAAIAGNTLQLCWCTDQAFRELQEAAWEALYSSLANTRTTFPSQFMEGSSH